MESDTPRRPAAARLARSRAAAAASTVTSRRRSAAPVYLISVAGRPNYGDELILTMWLRALAVLRPGTPVVVDCPLPGQASLLHGRSHPDVRFTDTVFRLVNEAGGDDGPGPDPGRLAVADIRMAVDNPGFRADLLAGVEMLRSAETVHVVGGGFVNDQWPRHLGLLAAAGSARELGAARQAVATGQGLLPNGDADALADAAAGMDLVSVRDAGSAEALGGVGAGGGATGSGAAGEAGVAGRGPEVRHVGDDAWLARSEVGRPVTMRRRGDTYSPDPEIARDVVLCLQDDVVNGSDVVAFAERVLREWDVPGRRMTVVEGIPRVDAEVWRRLLDRAGESGLDRLGLDDARFVPYSELRHIGLPARAGQTWLTTRFHPHLLAAAAGASGVAIDGKADYYGIKHGSLVAAGSPWEVVALGGGAGAGSEAGSGGGSGPGVPGMPSSGGFAEEVVRERAAAAMDLAVEIYG